jgi:hypothetical protein
MTDKDLQSLIVKLNKGMCASQFFRRPLSITVEYAKVWLKLPKPTDLIVNPGGPMDFYFIKNCDGVFVAIVSNMGFDLHAYVIPEHRKQGHLSKALKSSILPHIFQNKTEQRITIDREKENGKFFHLAEKVAYNLGFSKVVDESTCEYILAGDEYFEMEGISGTNILMSRERLDIIKCQINFLSRSLCLIHSEIETKLGNTDYCEELKDTIDQIWDHTWKIEEAWFDSMKSIAHSITEKK